MLLTEPLSSLITFLRTSLIKFYHNSQQMSNSFYYITESSERNKKKYSFGHVGQPCFRILA